MRRPTLGDPLQRGGLALHAWFGRLLHLSFTAQTWLLAVAWAVALTVAAWLSGCLFLDGANIGLFEHPAIWAFVGMQVVLPLAIRRSLVTLSQNRQPTFDRNFGRKLLLPLRAFTRLET